jgi:uncharacterized tellurite resistance protein B-like protein
MKTEREARLRSELAREADFLRRQQLLKALWRLTEGDGAVDGAEAQTTKAQAASGAAARSNRDEQASPRMAV